MAAPAVAAGTAARSSAPAAGSAYSAGGAGGPSIGDLQGLHTVTGGLDVDDTSDRGTDLAARLLAGALGLLALLMVIVAVPALLVTTILPGGGQGIDAGGIPAAAQPFVPIYQDAAASYHVNPFLLMAVHEDETGFSTCNAPGCPSRYGTTNSAGAAGAMQFITGTWAAYANAFTKAHLSRAGADYRHAHGPHPNRWDDYDAIYAAAAYFRGLGAGPQLDEKTYTALLSYKGAPPASIPFARHDYARAKQLEALAATGTAGAIEPGAIDGDPLQRVIYYANAVEQLKLPYCWGGGHGTTVGPSYIANDCWRAGSEASGRVFSATGLDCSGSVRWLLSLAGFPDKGPMVSGTFATAYPSGPGKHVTIWSNDDHVFVTINGRAWGTSDGNFGNGPGWAQHTTAGFIPSHPPGL